MGSRRGAGRGEHLPFKGRPSPLLPTEQQLVGALQVEGGEGVAGIHNVVEKGSFAKGLRLPPAGPARRCSPPSPSDNYGWGWLP